MHKRQVVPFHAIRYLMCGAGITAPAEERCASLAGHWQKPNLHVSTWVAGTDPEPIQMGI